MSTDNIKDLDTKEALQVARSLLDDAREDINKAYSLLGLIAGELGDTP